MIRIQREPIDISQVLAAVADEACGATVLFTGQTRRWTGELQTQSLSYEAFEPMAMKQLDAFRTEAMRQFDVRRAAVIHRIGDVAVGEISVAVAVSSAHRDAAFAAAAWLMDELKRDVAIWKREHSPEGEQRWVHPESTARDATEGLEG